MSPWLPRDVSGSELAKLLEAFGCVVTRQKGSHFRLTTQEGGEHHVTLPKHDALRTGTLNGVLKDVAEHVGTTRDLVAEKLCWLRRPTAFRPLDPQSRGGRFKSLCGYREVSRSCEGGSLTNPEKGVILKFLVAADCSRLR
jgi:predicted RNA binding protein YcfA (HicA-like mRNA interferase family)